MGRLGKPHPRANPLSQVCDAARTAKIVLYPNETKEGCYGGRERQERDQGPCSKVLLHRPGNELLNLTPNTLEAAAVRRHSVFAGCPGRARRVSRRLLRGQRRGRRLPRGPDGRGAGRRPAAFATKFLRQWIDGGRHQRPSATSKIIYELPAGRTLPRRQGAAC